MITSAQIIEELIQLAKDIREADKRGEQMNLRVDELAFYDAPRRWQYVGGWFCAGQGEFH